MAPAPRRRSRACARRAPAPRDRSSPASPRPRATDDDAAVRDRVGVIRVHRLTELVHDVVRHVHDRRDGAHAGGQQAALHPGWRGAASRIPSNQRAVKRGQRRGPRSRSTTCSSVRRPASSAHRGIGHAELRAGEGGDLASQPHHRQRVSTVRLDVNVEDHLAEDRRAGRRPGRSRPPCPGCGSPRHRRRGRARAAEQSIPLRDDAADLACARCAGPRAARHRPAPPAPAGRARCCPRRTRSRSGLRPDVDARQPQRVGVRMALDAEQAADHDIGPVRTADLDAAYLHAAQGQLFGESLRVERRRRRSRAARRAVRASVSVPRRTAARKRRSAPYRRRRSGIPWRSRAIRSRPIPKAYPW